VPENLEKTVKLASSSLLFRVLLDVDGSLCKAAGGDVFRKYEDLLTEVYLRTFKKQMKSCISEAASVVLGTKTINEKTVSRLMGVYKKHFKKWSKSKVLLDAVKGTTKKIYLVAREESEEKILKLLTKKPIKKKKIDITVGTDEDTKAIEVLSKQQAFWMGEIYESKFQDMLKKYTEEEILKTGLDAYEIGENFKKTLSALYGFTPEPPKGWKGHPDDYFAALSTNVATVARTHGTLRSFQKYGVTKYQVSNPEDERTCPRCSHAADHPFELSGVTERLDKLIEADTPEKVRKLHPWLSEKEFLKVPKDKLPDGGLSMPPFHPSCRCAIDIVEDFEVNLEPESG